MRKKNDSSSQNLSRFGSQNWPKQKSAVEQPTRLRLKRAAHGIHVEPNANLANSQGKLRGRKNRQSSETSKNRGFVREFEAIQPQKTRILMRIVSWHRCNENFGKLNSPSFDLM